MDQLEGTIWQNKMADLKVCDSIIFKHHPNGQFTLIEDYEFHEDSGLVDIKLNRAMCEIVRYFMDKYGDIEGKEIYQRFLFDFIFMRQSADLN